MDILTLSFWKSITDSLVVFPLLKKYAQRQFGSFPQIPVGMKINIFETTTQSHIVNFANSNLQIFGLVVHHRLGCRRRWRDPSRDVGLYAKCSRERSGEIYTGISWCLIIVLPGFLHIFTTSSCRFLPNGNEFLPKKELPNGHFSTTRFGKKQIHAANTQRPATLVWSPGWIVLFGSIPQKHLYCSQSWRYRKGFVVVFFWTWGNWVFLSSPLNGLIQIWIISQVSEKKHQVEML